jgi:alanyl-tRNA synthetase
MNIAHTAEHIFLGSLTRLLPDVSVKKVEILNDRNAVYLKCSSLDWDIVLEAEKMTNQIISEGRWVKEHHYSTLEEAKTTIPGLRAHEERISGEVRVIEVEGYDYSACTGVHVQNTKECVFFIATRFSKANKDLFVIEFEVGEKAKIRSLEIAKTCMKTADTLGTTLTTLEKTAKNIKDENLKLKDRLIFLTSKEAQNISHIEEKDVKLYIHMFEGLDTKILMDRAGELIKQENTIVIFTNREEQTNIILARSSGMKMDCNSILRGTLSSYGGRGGGTPEYAFGTVTADHLSKAVEDLQTRVKNEIQTN